jgi:histidine kinase
LHIEISETTMNSSSGDSLEFAVVSSHAQFCSAVLGIPDSSDEKNRAIIQIPQSSASIEKPQSRLDNTMLPSASIDSLELAVDSDNAQFSSATFEISDCTTATIQRTTSESPQSSSSVLSPCEASPQQEKLLMKIAEQRELVSPNTPKLIDKLERQDHRDNSTATTVSESTFDEIDEHLYSPVDGDNDHAANRFREALNRSPSFRRSEINFVRSCYESKLNGECASSFLAISGPSGSGKSRLARSLQDSVTNSGGYFLTGKFDFLEHPEPYKALVWAFSEFTSQVMDRGSDEVEFMRNSILAALGEDICVLTSMIPSLELILGTSSAKQSSGPKANEAMNRFLFLFTRFIRSICSPDKPLVLLLDDLHWADSCSLDVLGCIAKATDSNGFFMIVTYDETDLAVRNPHFAQKLVSMGQCGCVNVKTVNVGYISEPEFASLLADALKLEPTEELKNFANILYSKTPGNISCILVFLSWLQRNELLVYDKAARQWRWDDEELRNCLNAHISCFRVDEFQQLSSQTQDVLKVAACLGYHFEPFLIEYVLGIPVHDCIQEAIEKGFLISEGSSVGYSFCHDTMHYTIYNLISQKDRDLFHLEIGRRLWRRLNQKELDRNVFILLSQVRKGVHLINRENERHGLAGLCLHAGTKAAKASSFRTAALYLKLGAGFLDERSWRTEYNLCLSVYDAAAEMELCTTNLEEMDSLIDTVLLHAMKCEDKIQAYSTRIYAMGMTGRSREAVAIGVEVLKHLGETFPRHLNRSSLCSEVCSVNRLLRGKSDDDILQLPSITNERKLAALNILQLIFLTAMTSWPELAPFVASKCIKITLKYGLSVYSSVGFSIYGMTFLGACDNVEEAFRFGNLGMELLNKYKVVEYLPRVYAGFYGCIYAWKKPVHETLEPLLRAHRIGLQTGDIEFSTLCSNLYCFLAIESGTPLDKVLKQMEYFREISISTRQVSLLKMSVPCIQAIRFYIGNTQDQLSSKQDLVESRDSTGKEDFNFSSMSPDEESDPAFSVNAKGSQMILKYAFNESEGLEELSSFVMKNTLAMAPTIHKANLVFYAGMIALEMASNGVRRRKNIYKAKSCIKSLKKYSRNCPSNFAHKRFLLDAELAKVNGLEAKAFENYTCAIALAKISGSLCFEGLANERICYFLIGINKVSDAEPYYRRASGSYTEWGAHAKVSHLKKKLDHFFQPI